MNNYYYSYKARQHLWLFAPEAFSNVLPISGLWKAQRKREMLQLDSKPVSLSLNAEYANYWTKFFFWEFLLFS